MYDDWIEYRCEFNTNKYGLIDTNYDDTSSAVDFLVLGDSFLEGHVGCPWLTADTIPTDFPVLINGGLQGAGILSFEQLESWLSRDLVIGNVIIVAISNGFNAGQHSITRIINV